uniref:Uncharacterized protein n=1 Tax=Trypanosoma vivax (strain Y486) TaxID=1055687 RepID=G0U228_TRYVY|nr:hypothetical protein TVY486_0901540 [Trypanosoma vivax Y486]
MCDIFPLSTGTSALRFPFLLFARHPSCRSAILRPVIPCPQGGGTAGVETSLKSHQAPALARYPSQLSSRALPLYHHLKGSTLQQERSGKGPSCSLSTDSQSHSFLPLV